VRNEFVDELLVRARKDPKIVLITGDLGFGVLDNFWDSLPKQFVNLGITEQSSISYAAGLARNELRPFFYSIGNFPTLRALEQIRNDVVFMELPVTIVAVGAGFAYGTAGYSHHLIEDFGAMSALNLEIYSPTMPRDIQKCLDSILSQQYPAYLRLGKGGEKNFDVSHSVYDFPGVLNHIPETELTVMVNSAVIEEVVKAVEILDEGGTSVAILSCWKSTGYSHEEISFLSSRKKIVVIEEHVIRGGFGSYICECLGESNQVVTKIGISKLRKKLNGSTKFLRQSYGLSSQHLAETLMSLHK
jgi:transketolase